jgi:signal recognition particle subunit SRP19
MKLRSQMILWPANLDSTKSRIQGRKIAKGSAVQTPRLDEISEAAKKLNLGAETSPGKSRPRTWWEKNGYLIVAKKPKSEVLRNLATEIRRIRAARTSA